MNVAKPTTSEWLSLIGRSHQTSLYVLPEWLKLHHVETLVVKTAHGVAAGIVVAPQHTPLPFIQYQGLLLTYKEQPAVVERLLREVETWGGAKAVWCAPSLVDIRPFTWRWYADHVLWRSEIRYTVFLESKEPAPPLGAARKPDLAALEKLFPSDQMELLEQICRLPSVEVFQDGSKVAVVGTDRQNRGYLIASTRNSHDLVLRAAASFPSFDIGGVNSPETHERWKGLNGKLRTIYALHL